MTRVRFNTDRALFDTFPSARDHVKTEPLGAPPLVFLRSLAESRKLDEAISFCAYLLPRREAVAWGCRALGQPGLKAPPALRAAQAWVETPEEEARCLAHDAWSSGDKEDPLTWLALAAAWSGGSLTPNAPASMTAPPHLTATAVRVALLLQFYRLKLPQKSQCAEAWIADGMRLAEGGL